MLYKNDGCLLCRRSEMVDRLKGPDGRKRKPDTKHDKGATCSGKQKESVMDANNFDWECSRREHRHKTDRRR